MENNVDLNELWGKQRMNPPQVEEVVSQFSKIKRKNLVKVLAVNILMLFTIAGMILLWQYVEPRLITTKAGITTMILAIVAYLLVYNRLIPLLREVNENQSNRAFLEAAVKLKQQQKLLQTSMLQLYFVAMTHGLCRCLYEYAALMPSPWSIITYSLTLAWIAFNWFYLRPRIVRREQGRLDEIIEKFENIKQQQ